MKFKILLPLLFVLNVNINAQSPYMTEMQQYDWVLHFLTIDGENIFPPTEPPGLENINLTNFSSSGLNSDWTTSLNYGGNSLSFNVDFHANEPSFVLNYGGVTLVDSLWPSFEDFYFSGIFLNYGNPELVNPFSFSIIYLMDTPFLGITNNLGNTAFYGVNNMNVSKNSQNNMDVIVHGNILEFTLLNEVNIEKAEIFNMQGQKVNFLYQTGTTSYSIEHLPQGIYIVQVYGSDTTVFRKKIIKQ